MKIKCPCCDGEGTWYEEVIYAGIGGGPMESCGFCKGTGEVSIFKAFYWWFSETFLWK